VTSRLRIDQAARIVVEGGVIVYPTEAVYGIGCLPCNDAALERIVRIKHRDARKGMIIVAAGIEQLAEFADLPDRSTGERMYSDWPGPVTWVVTAKHGVSPLLTGGRDTLAVRVSDHPIVRRLCQRTGSALVSTSANFSGRRPARSALQARRAVGREVDYVLAGPLGARSKPTEIRHFRTGEVLRPG
jgi:L-threonylcarbamoyladenylate synthase